jgi:hypothetical protein
MARFTKGASAWILVALASTTTGCAVHLMQPVKEVAYDFSDRDFYDRSYAPSPRYADDEATRGDAAPLASAPTDCAMSAR